MDISNSYFGFKEYMLHKCNDGYFLMDPTGDIATLDEITDLSEKLLDFATTFEKDILIHNLKNDAALRKRFRYGYQPTEKEPPGKRRVYLMECDGHYKVGVSADPHERARQLDRRPYPVEIVAQSDMVHCAFKAEREIHSRLDEFRIDGEWFRIPRELVDGVASRIRDINDADYGYAEG